jgi:hypothetical protein
MSTGVPSTDAHRLQQPVLVVVQIPHPYPRDRLRAPRGLRRACGVRDDVRQEAGIDRSCGGEAKSHGRGCI